MATVNLSSKQKFAKGHEKPKNKKKTLHRILEYLLSHPIYFILSIILTITSSVLALFGPKFSGDAISALSGGKGNVEFDKVWYYSILLVIFYISSSLLSALLNIIMVHYSQSIVKRMRKDLFDHICLMPISFYDKNKTGDIISRISYDIDSVNTSISSDIITIANAIITIVGSFIMMLVIKPILVLVFVVTVPLSIVYTKIIQKKIRRCYRLRSKALGEMNGYAEEMISGMKSVKAYSNEKSVYDDFETFSNKACEAECLAEKTMSWNFPGINLINNLSLSLISIISAILFMNDLMTIGAIASFVLYSRKFSGPINEIANIYSDIESALAAGERVFEVLDLEIEKDNPDSCCVTDTLGAIRFENVKFGYSNDKEIIHNLSLDVEPGKLVAIVGPTGAGKTTIINLLMRFYDIQGGKIYLDGKDINIIKKKNLRQLYSMVLQETWLRKGSILDNVRYGNPNATLEEVKNACRNANIDDYIISLKNGYDTILDENGNNISKGQKQLLTIARAMLLDSKILILDEATSNVDTSTEMKIQEAMRKLMENKTCFVIAHRLSTIRNADVILVLKDGDVIEQGTHDELVKLNGFYSVLYNSQFE